MPTLGFLKKKRTKESSSKDGSPLTTTATHTSSNVGSPVTPVGTNNFNDASAQQAQEGLQAEGGAPGNQSVQQTQIEQNQAQMNQGQQGSYQAQQNEQTQHNLPSISNLINPPQHDGASVSYPSQQQQNMSGQQYQNSGVGQQPQAQQLQQQQQPQQTQVRTTKGKYNLSDFDIQRTLGTGSFGRVHLVQSKHNQRYYAVKVLKKAQVVKMKQVEHTNDERKMLQEVKHPFLITLWGTFQDAKNIYMVMDFVEGGELFSLLRKSQVCGHHCSVLTSEYVLMQETEVP